MIHLENLTKEFKFKKNEPGLKGAVKGLFKNDKETKVAVNDISFDIAAGEIVGYIGANGAGKSTTIKMMTGILVPTRGKCIVNGIIPYEKRTENAKNIGVVFGQRTQLWWDLPLGETFTILRDIYDVPHKAFEERMEFLESVLGFNEFKHSSVRTLSLGQRMRADLAAAMIHNPKILYLDEPSIGLDVVVKENIRKALERSADLEADKIKIETMGNKVILKGSARSWNERKEVERAAAAAPGVAEVDDQLAVIY